MAAAAAGDPNDDVDVDDDRLFAGVPTAPEDLYAILLFFLLLHLIGDYVCSRALRIVPSLVGYVLVGIAFGPEGFDLLSTSVVETFAALGNVGLALLMAQAGMEMDYETLRLVGPRGVVVAATGTVLPIAIGTAVASRCLDDWRGALAAGCSFGPTSAGIAMNVLGRCRVLPPPPDPAPSSAGTSSPTSAPSCGGGSDAIDDAGRTGEGNDCVLNLPVGQLVVAAAIVDDILALVTLSQLRALGVDRSSDERNKAWDVAVPIVSAFLWLVVGGSIALWIFPKVLAGTYHRIASSCPGFEAGVDDGTASLAVLFGLLYLLLPAAHFSGASYLLAAFLSGLAFCRDPSDVDGRFRREFARPMEYLMKLFFGASIGFQVPVRSFGDATVVARGCFFSLALLGKLAVGLLTPNFYADRKAARLADGDDGNGDSDKDNEFTATKRFRGGHLRDCFVVGFSMMGEAEFAFVVAVYGVSEGLVPPDVYASIVWAILSSTVISPLLLKTTLAFFPYRGIVADADVGTSEKIEGDQD